jgi:hypothetical protein
MTSYRGPLIAGGVLGFVLAAFAFSVLSIALRAPVLVLGDQAFTMLYGQERLLKAQVEATLRLWRPVLPVNVEAPVNASERQLDEAAARAAGNASPSPFLLLFPRRYAGAVPVYCSLFPKNASAVRVLDGRENVNGSDGRVHFKTDSTSDWYAAGCMAALLAGRKEVVVFSSAGLTAPENKALTAGLAREGMTATPRFLGPDAGKPGQQTTGCIIYADTAGRSGGNGDAKEIPSILFSWLDPSLMSSGTAAVLDDSVWAQILPIYKGEKAAASKVTVEKNFHKILSKKILPFDKNSRIVYNGE